MLSIFFKKIEKCSNVQESGCKDLEGWKKKLAKHLTKAIRRGCNQEKVKKFFLAEIFNYIYMVMLKSNF